MPRLGRPVKTFVSVVLLLLACFSAARCSGEAGLGRQQAGRADLHVRPRRAPAPRQCRAVFADPAGGDHRHLHRIEAHTCSQRHRAGLARDVVGQGTCRRCPPASLPCRDYHIAAVVLQPALLLGRGGPAPRSSRSASLTRLTRAALGRAEMEAHDLGLELEHLTSRIAAVNGAGVGASGLHRPPRGGSRDSRPPAAGAIRSALPRPPKKKNGKKLTLIGRPVPGFTICSSPRRVSGRQHGGGDRAQSAGLRGRDRHLRRARPRHRRLHDARLDAEAGRADGGLARSW